MIDVLHAGEGSNGEDDLFGSYHITLEVSEQVWMSFTQPCGTQEEHPKYL